MNEGDGVTSPLYSETIGYSLYLMFKAIKILGLLAAVMVVALGTETAEGVKEGELALVEDVSTLR